MDMPEATQEQIEAFEKGAADRFAELGVPGDVAQKLYVNQLNKMGEQLAAPAVNKDTVEKVASDIATALGKERPAKKSG